MPIQPFDYSYPEELIALQPKEPCRILNADRVSEINKAALMDLFQEGDILVVNNSKVLKRRIITDEKLEILFLEAKDEDRTEWEVLFPARGLKLGAEIQLPEGISAKLQQKGLPQILKFEQEVPESYFVKHAELALPPYIQQARGDRHNWSDDESWYQTAWAKSAGSVASPTASLHFTAEDLERLKNKGVRVEEVTLHVGAGTFLPIRTENLEEHIMHSEWAEISESTIAQLDQAKSSGQRIWALGTTACRTVESYGAGLLKHFPERESYCGDTQLFIYPGYQWKYVSGLLTNFHQPKTTLLALVEAFAGRELLEKVYAFAIENKFRLFSYGDLSVWTRKV